MNASLQSYDGSVVVSLNYDDEGKLNVNLALAEGSSAYGSTVFHGTLDELKAKLAAK